MPDPGLPIPWRIIAGPRPLPQSVIDGTAWGFTLERDGVERSLIVVVSAQAQKLGASGPLPTETREAIKTDGRSEAARVAQLDEQARVIVLGRDGYLPPPAALMRIAQ
ncbi:MAG TPA: hypothetical protein VE777_11085 [Gaiellales bacterium]|jgi:hypothetical protein|nr:hypothetical protein [Gaiellales bacterium]